MTISRVAALCLLVAGCTSIDAPRTEERALLSFTSALGGPDPSPQTFRVETPRYWRVTTTANWVRVSPDSGLGPASITVSTRPLLLVGDITDTVRVTSADGIVEVPVKLHRTGRPPRGFLYGITYPPSSTSYSMFTAAADGSGAHELRFAYHPGYPGPKDPYYLVSIMPAYSPGGDSIAFLASGPEGQSGIWITTSDGGVVGGHDLGTCRYSSLGVGWSPVGDTISWMCSGSGPGSDFLLIAGRPALKLPGAGNPLWSPDGTWILIGGAISNLLISADRTRSDTTLQVTYPLAGVGWTPDNRIILGACGTGVYTIGRGAALLRGATPTRVLGPEYGYATFSPDGTKLLAVRCSPSTAVELMNSDGTNVTWTMPGANWAAWRP